MLHSILLLPEPCNNVVGYPPWRPNREHLNEQPDVWWFRTRVINEYARVEAPWCPDIVGRAWGNRGNARSRQGKLQEALSDYNTAIELCPWSVDPLLNRGAVLEQLGRCAPLPLNLLISIFSGRLWFCARRDEVLQKYSLLGGVLPRMLLVGYPLTANFRFRSCVC